MLRELFQYVTTTCHARWVRKMGFLYEAIALEARYRRCQTQWQSHFEACQQAILQAVESVEKTDTILIMGAGSLKDIPLSQLSETFNRVILLDVVFLKSARQTASTFHNVELLEADASNCLANVYQGNRIIDKTADRQMQIGSVDCIVSLNLVTQIPLIPVRWLIDKYGLSVEDAGKFGRKLVQNHLDWLDDQPCVKCLIADREIQEYDSKGHQVDAFDPAWEVTLPDPSVEWNWEVIPLSESTTGTSQVNHVGVSIWH